MTTVPVTTPQTTIPAAPITNTATYTADCVEDFLTPPANHHPLTYKVTATALSPVAVGGTITITNQEWQVIVPAALVAQLSALLPNGLNATSTGSLVATNVADPKISTSPPIQTSTALPATGDLVTTVHPADASFTATGGDVEVKFSGATNSVDLAGTPVLLTCTPTGAVPTLLTIKVPGQSAPTTTTPFRVPVNAAPLPAPAVASSGQIPRTGSNSSVLWVELFGGLLIIQFGIMMWSAGQGRRRRRAV